ncbi:hypothetical protein [Eisenibacter elegans]|jgi:hypothetical protein|uniref:hypothetical protein n=1 Tax=Eisenibacter elegans TaxID=997 RepID=UPI000428FFA6|nr:hypothetical protein [Eisenibacter elegans]
MSSTVFTYLISFVVYAALQVFFVSNLVLFELAFCYLYVAFLLTLPKETDHSLAQAVGFLIGLVVDIFQNTWGTHASACVLVMFLRPYIANLVAQRERSQEFSREVMGNGAFGLYSLSLIFIHSLLVVLIETADMSRFFASLLRVVASTLFTFTVVMIVQFLYVPKKAKL